MTSIGRLNPKNSLRTRVALAIGGVALAMTWAITAFVGFYLTRHLQLATTDKLAAITRSMATEIDLGAQERARDIAAIASDPAFAAGVTSPGDHRAMLAHIVSVYPDFSWAGVVTAAGRVSSATAGAKAGYDLSKTRAFENGRGGLWISGFDPGEQRASAAQRWDGAATPVLQIACPLRDPSGKLTGVMIAHLSSAWLHAIRSGKLAERDVTRGYEAIVADETGRILSVETASRGPVDLNNRGYVYTMARAWDGPDASPGIDLVVYARQRRELATQPARTVQGVVLLFGGIAGIIAIALGWVIAGRIIRPLVLTADAADALYRGDEDTEIPVIDGEDELARLSASLRLLVEGLRSSEERYRRLLDTSMEAIIHIDAAGCIDYANPRSERMLGYQPGDLIGISAYDLLFDEDHAGVSLAGGEMRDGLVEQYEMRLRTAQGQEIWVVMCASVVHVEGVYVGTFWMAVDITERKRTEAALELSLNRQVLLNDVGAKLRESTHPQEIQQAAVRALGSALAADRCLFVFVDAETGAMQIDAQYVKPGLTPLPPEMRCSENRRRLSHIFPSGKPLVVSDAATDTAAPSILDLLDLHRVRSLVVVPLLDDGQVVAALCLCTEAPRVWKWDEIGLSESVATQVRSAIDASRIAHREHRIASVLQDALQPSLHIKVARLDVASYYKPALDEASIGGDFFDVFHIGDDRYALVIADVSGKGLAAAVEVANVRSMLRCVLYEGKAPDEALSALNTIFVRHRLVPGFVTLFVGVFSSGERSLTYASAGHEPMLLCRKSAQAIQELEATGAPLGVVLESDYELETLPLAPGDTLLLYTDGLSEAGPDRMRMLGTQGLGQLLAAHTDAETAAELKVRIMHRVEEFAGGGLRDDACMVAAIVR